MSYLLTLYRDAELTLATTEPVLPPDQLAPLQDALALAERLSALLARQQSALVAAEAEARAAGDAAGYVAGQARAQAEAAATLADSLSHIAAEQAAQRDELRQALIALASGMVRRMAADLAPAEVLAALAERAFDHVVPPQPVRLKLPPALVEPVRTELARRELPLPVQCGPDAQLHGLQCTIESQAGVLIAGLDEVLARTAQSLELSQRAHAAPEAVR